MHTPPPAGAVDPPQATTAAELGACLRSLRTAAGLSLRDLEKAGRSSASGLARSTVQAVEQGERLPKPDWLAAYLTACGVRGARQRPWLRVRAAIAVGPGGVDTAPVRLPRVDACDPRRLGVHASITLSTRGEAAARGPQLPELPRYVPRDVDEEVREAVVEAAGRGGLVVVVGSSSTGKTRTVYEAVMAELPGWRLFHPAEAGELAAAVASRQLPRGGIVVWLDEAQHYLADPNRLTVGTMRTLLNPDQPVVVVATMWPQWHERFTAAPPSDPGVPDLHRHARQILTTMARVVRLGEFTRGERDCAASLAHADPRLAIALQESNFGPTQVLAGAPQLVDRWEHASDPYAKAVMTAAIDLRRLGHLAPLPAELLGAAAPGYLTGRQQATAASDWLAAALAYATKELHGATAALVPVAGPRMGEVAGYVVADYLLQHGQTTRQAVPPPGSLWDSAAAHVIDSADRVRLAREASSRSLNRHAVRLITPAAQAGNLEAMHLLAGWLWLAGHRTEMRRWVDRALHAGNPGTLVWLASILGEIDQLQEREELLWELAAKGHPIGLWGLVRLLDGTGRSQAAEKLLGGMAEVGDRDAIWEMVELLEQRGQGPRGRAGCAVWPRTATCSRCWSSPGSWNRPLVRRRPRAGYAAPPNAGTVRRCWSWAGCWSGPAALRRRRPGCAMPPKLAASTSGSGWRPSAAAILGWRAGYAPPPNGGTTRPCSSLPGCWSATVAPRRPRAGFGRLPRPGRSEQQASLLGCWSGPVAAKRPRIGYAMPLNAGTVRPCWSLPDYWSGPAAAKRPSAGYAMRPRSASP